MENVSFWSANSAKNCYKFNVPIIFKYLDDFLVFWMDDSLIYSQTEEEHLKHFKLVFSKLREAGIKLKMSNCELFKNKSEYSGHLVSGEGISPLRQKIKAITDMVPTTNNDETRHIIGLIGYYRKFFPVFSDIIRPLKELTKKMYPSNGESNVRKV